ncbi:MAG: aminoacetone oxidase family FAD-binding enzyme [Bacteroidales bacterium]|nr:aminoacetone oxidase family FAD-binding enzyme [Bacteroidales bacterium]
MAIVGAGAAGCLAAIEAKRRMPGSDVRILEAGAAPMAKLALTGGGRCNLTNTFEEVTDLKWVYPRGERLMKRALRQFGAAETMRWFEEEGVRLTEEEGGRIFPASGDARQVVQALERALRRLDISLLCRRRVLSIRPVLPEGRYELRTGSGETFPADAVIVTTGGSPRRSGLSFLDPLDLATVPPVPSLFTLRLSDSGLKALMGTVAPDAVLSIPGTGFKASGPLLLTDWGIGGPATLRLSSYAARYLADCGYGCPVAVNWTGANEQEVRDGLQRLTGGQSRKLAANTPLPGLSARLWSYLLERSGARPDIRWGEFGGKGLNRLISTLTNDVYETTGRAAFKEEFVTCGGVSLDAIHPHTLEAKTHTGLFFAGEVLDIDAVTGGFNLQAAWTTGWICARSTADYCTKSLSL